MSSSNADQPTCCNDAETGSRSSAMVALNNRGVKFLAKFRYKDAASCFSKGLALAKQWLLHFETTRETDTSSKVPTPTGHFHQAVIRKPLHYSNKFEDQEAGDQPFVFTRSIFISEDTALSTEDGSRTKLLKALSLYELAYRLQRDEDTEATVLQQMAIVNNVGSIHGALQQVECSRQCFENLLSTIMFVKDCGEADSVQDMDGFLSNTLPLMSIAGCTFAAAA
jgi:tetratricopeptide (TPR) repeat protein